MSNIVETILNLVIGVISGIIVLFVEYNFFSKSKTKSNSPSFRSSRLDDTKPRLPKVFPSNGESPERFQKNNENHTGFMGYIIHQLKLGWVLFLDGRTPIILRLLLGIGIVYVIFPYDLLSGYIFGYIDDLIIFTIFLWWLIEYSPSELKDEHIKRLGL